MAIEVPTINLGGHAISRLLLGGNPLSGLSHYSEARDRWLRRLLTYDAIVDLMLAARAHGINAIVARGDPHVFRIMDEYEKRAGERFLWLAQTAPERGDPVESIDEIARHKPIAIYLHGGRVCGRYYDREKRAIPRAPEFIDRIRSHGLLAGLASHNPEIIEVCEDRGYAPDFYLQSLNPIGYYCEAPPERVGQALHATHKPVIVFKVLAAGRVEPKEGIPLALRLCKANDCLAIGAVFLEELEENATLVRSALGAG